MRFLLSRPIAESEKLAYALALQNIDSVIEPVLILKYLAKIPLELNRFQALLFTSPNAIRAFDHHYKAEDIDVYCVGNKTAKMAKSIGFNDVFSADGDLYKLSDMIISSLDPRDGPLLYLAGKHVFGDLRAMLENAGFSVEKNEIYDMVAIKNLSENTKFHFERGDIDYTPFYSSRSALIFIELIKKAGIEKYLCHIKALCLSPAIADVIKNLNWQEIIVADKPNQYDLLKKINIEI